MSNTTTYGMFATEVQYSNTYLIRRDHEECLRLAQLVRQLVTLNGWTTREAVYYVAVTFRLDKKRCKSLIRFL